MQEQSIVAILEFYFKLLFEKVGLSWTVDNTSEMQQVAAAITAVAEQAARDHAAGLNRS